ncbi:MAG: multidrug efflux protein NorA [Candidatus Hydrogenedentes bacterium ADurb.Bin101]|nr:MAG: multidrug efflux protein NorA [Candidatus Hydrogenedentes bacterium ADurb.Bin101]
MGVMGAGLGTVLAPIFSCALGLYLIYSRRMIIQPPALFHLWPDMRLLKNMVGIGVPTGIQGVLLNIAGVLLIWYISALPHSAAAQAAYTICYTQLFSLVTWTSFGLRNASATLMGQNIGAGNPHRGKECVLIAAALGAIWSLIIGTLFWTMPDTLLGLFNATEEPVHGLGIALLKFLAVSAVFFAVTQAFTGALQGAGATRPPHANRVYNPNRGAAGLVSTVHQPRTAQCGQDMGCHFCRPCHTPALNRVIFPHPRLDSYPNRVALREAFPGNGGIFLRTTENTPASYRFGESHPAFSL